MLFYADITVLSPLPSFEIAEVRLMDELPDHWTYPKIQPFLLEKVRKHLKNSKKRG